MYVNVVINSGSAHVWYTVAMCMYVIHINYDTYRVRVLHLRACVRSMYVLCTCVAFHPRSLHHWRQMFREERNNTASYRMLINH